jgi:hypothetical protein
MTNDFMSYESLYIISLRVHYCCYPVINIAKSSVYNSVGVRNLHWWAYGGVLFYSLFHLPLYILSVGTGPHNLGSVVGRVFIKQALEL